jgi:hypothetical protein
LYRLQEFVNFLQWNVELSWFMEGRMHKKREISFQVFINFYRRKRPFDSLDARSCKDEMASKNCLKNGWIVQFSHITFSDFAPDFCILFPSMIIILRQRIFYNFKPLKKDCNSILYNAKHGDCVNPVSYRKLVLLNIRIKVGPVWQLEQYKCHFTNKILLF